VPSVKIVSRVLAACAAAAFLAGAAAGQTTRDPSYSYAFEVSAARVVATYTLHGAKTVTSLHIKAPSRRLQLDWTGSFSVRSPKLVLVGNSAYTSKVASCASTSPFPPHATQFYVSASGSGLVLDVEKFPVGGIGDGQDNGATDGSPPPCGYPASVYFDVARLHVPYVGLSRPVYTATATKPVANLGDGQTLAWTVQMTLKRISFRLLKK
jgi:hypothetical protein